MTDARDEKDRLVPDILSILPLRNTVVFPRAVVPLGAGRASSLRLIEEALAGSRDRKSTRLNSSHRTISYAVFCLKKKKRIMTYKKLVKVIRKENDIDLQAKVILSMRE